MIETQKRDPSYRPVVAIIDDDAELRASLAALLQDNGFDPLVFSNSAGFYALGPHPHIDLALIDLKLEGESGLSLAIHIRANHQMPIVMLTGLGDELDKIIGLETGADDYVTKPFNPRELIARLRAVLRRSGTPPFAPQERIEGTSKTTAPRFGAMQLDPVRKELVGPSGLDVPLTNAEYRLLEYFLRHPNRIVPRTELLTELGNDLSLYMDRTIDVLILRLRRKIEVVPSKPLYLQTRRGLGYIFMTDTK